MYIAEAQLGLWIIRLFREVIWIIYWLPNWKITDYLCDILKLQITIDHYRINYFLHKIVNKRSYRGKVMQRTSGIYLK